MKAFLQSASRENPKFLTSRYNGVPLQSGFMYVPKVKFSLGHWLVIAFITRMISALTHATWNHPDEWFQTSEFAHFISAGVQSFTQEVALHLRNLTWPVILQLPLSIAEWIAPHSVSFRFFGIQVWTALLDCVFVLCWWVCLKRSCRDDRWIQIGMALAVLSAFHIHDIQRPSGETVSTVFIWISLALISVHRYFLAGVFAVGIAAMKYPAGLATLGIALAVFFGAKKSRWAFGGGLLLGLGLFGLSDAAFYGRPWESLWMFLQYNVFTGLGGKNFGTQPPSVYLDIILGHWGGILLPVGVILLMGIPIGLRKGLLDKEPWAWAFISYLIGHLLIGHKEPRFMIPIEFLAVFSGWIGIVHLSTQWSRDPGTVPRSFAWLFETAPRVFRTRSFKVLSIVWTCIYSLIFFRALWGDSLRSSRTYFEVDDHLKSHPKACAVISVRRPISLTLPPVSFAYWPMEKGDNQQRPLIWIEKPPQCSAQENEILLHVHRPDSLWTDKGCDILPSAVLKWIPRSQWDSFIEKRWVSGPWYRCPSTVLANFPKQETRSILATHWRRFSHLPRLGISGEEYWKQYFESYPSTQDGTLGDW